MRKAASATAALLLAAAEGSADVWDLSSPFNDDQLVNTPNFLVHGNVQVHDLGVRPGPVSDVDWFEIYSAPYSSYEFLQDGSTGDMLPVTVERRDAAGNLLQVGIDLGNVLGPANAISMRWENIAATVQYDFVRVTSSPCGTSCTSDDQYTMRFYDTTYSIPRFNNFGGQVTVLIVQSLSQDSLPVAANAHFWDTSGALLAILPFVLNARSTLVVNTATIPGLSGTSGVITITNTARYGGLSGKAVAVEPATGFSFDSPMAPKAY